MRWFNRLLPYRTVSLIIDDGPTAATPRLLDALEAAGHRAVLFVLGCNIAGREAVLVDAVRRGFALGNHSYSHPFFSQIGLASARDEIVRTDALIDVAHRDAGLIRPGKWFRFPYLDRGERNAEALQLLLQELGYTVPDAARRRDLDGDADRRDWPTTIPTRDWALPPQEAFRQSVRGAQPGDAIEFHDKLETIEHYLEALIQELARGRLSARIPEGVR